MNFESYIEKSLINMQELKDRAMMRQVFSDVLIPMYQYAEENFKNLELNLQKEEESVKDKYPIITGIVERKLFDITSKDMKLMNVQDSEEKQVDLNKVIESMQQHEECKLFSVFLHTDYRKIQQLEALDKKFSGTIRTEEGEFQGEFRLKKNWDYIKKVWNLYSVFIHNGISWNTVCAPYLFKIYDVCLMNCEQISGTSITEINIDFEAYKSMIKYDYVPIWNLDEVTIKSNALPEPVEDQSFYQHVLYKEKLGDDKYLIMNTDIPILNQRRINGDLYITCREKNAVLWKLLRFSNSSKSKFTEPLFHNHCNDFSGRGIRTKAGLHKFIHDLGYSEYIQLKNITVLNKIEDDLETYSMDEFLRDEIIFQNNNHTLVFEFESIDKDNYLNQDILSYIVTKLQWEYPEYHCIGKLV